VKLNALFCKKAGPHVKANKYIFIPNIPISVQLFLEGLEMENVGIFYVHSVYLAVIWFTVWLFRKLTVIL
jgi:hypothetical protein